MKTENLEVEIRVKFPETPRAAAQQEIRTRIEAELAEMFPGTSHDVRVQEGSWELVIGIILGTTLWVAERTLGEWLKRKAQLRAEAGAEKAVTKSDEAASIKFQAPENVDGFATMIRRPDAPDSSLWGELARKFDETVSEVLEEPDTVIERGVFVKVRTKSGLEASWTYTRSLDSHSLISELKEPLPRRDDRDNTIESP